MLRSTVVTMYQNLSLRIQSIVELDWIGCHGMAPCNNVIIFHCVLGIRLWRNRKCWEQPEHWSLVQTATSLQLFLAPCVIPKRWYPIEPIFVDVTNTINYFLFSFVFDLLFEFCTSSASLTLMNVSTFSIKTNFGVEKP